MARHYADVFHCRPGRCFRYVYDRNTQPTPCPEPAIWKGTFTDALGRRHEAEACTGHMEDLEDPTTAERPT